MRRILTMSGLVLVCGLLACSSVDRDPQTQADRAMPAFSMTDTDGKTITNDALKGHVYVLDFWATWCGPCRELSPVLDGLSKKYADKGLVVIGADSSEEPGGHPAADYKKEHGYSYTFTEGNDSLVHSLGIDGFPTVYVVDKQGTVRHVFEGYGSGSEAELDTAISELL